MTTSHWGLWAHQIEWRINLLSCFLTCGFSFTFHLHFLLLHGPNGKMRVGCQPPEYEQMQSPFIYIIMVLYFCQSSDWLGSSAEPTYKLIFSSILVCTETFLQFSVGKSLPNAKNSTDIMFEPWKFSWLSGFCLPQLGIKILLFPSVHSLDSPNSSLISSQVRVLMIGCWQVRCLTSLPHKTSHRHRKYSYFLT